MNTTTKNKPALNTAAVVHTTDLYHDVEYLAHIAAIVDSSDDAIISKTLQGIIKSWNKGGETMFGYTAEEAVGSHISIIIPPEFINEEKKILEKISSNEIQEHYETVRNNKDGHQFFVSITVSPIKDRTGKIIGISKIARDITARKNAELELISATKELIFRNEEKERHSAALKIANNELLSLNEKKHKRAAELVIANKELAFQNREKEKRAAELIIANKELAFQNDEKEKRAAELIVANLELAFQNKEREKRAAELIVANRELGFENEEKEHRAFELVIANKELVFQSEEKEKRAAELRIANRELSFQNEEKEKRAAELVLANEELLFQNIEKEKRAAELRIANRELIFQNEEKEKRAAELNVANMELAFQNDEKEKRAAELIIANRELGFQNEEKEKRAAELIIALEELAFQNEEKGKRAAELIIALRELGFQNEEKEARAAELIIANQELLFQNEEKEKRATESRIANRELGYQNEEKEKRAAELIFANKELLSQNTEKEKLAADLTIAIDELGIQNKGIEIAAANLILANKELALQNVEKQNRAEELAASINELKIAEGQLQSTVLELESFSYSVSHDLRAPLRAIHGYSQMLKSDYQDKFDSEGNRMMNNIMSNAKKMGQLIDDLLAFSRLGRKEIVKMQIPMKKMVSQFCSELKAEQSHRNIEFRIGTIASAQADNQTIKQVWLNLIQNAVKYSRLKDNAIIEIGSQVKGKEIIYYIKDNGAGFDMRYVSKLFGVFQRLHSEDEFEGTGVGLAIVKRIISKHGGRVWAESQEEKGATFYFTLKK